MNRPKDNNTTNPDMGSNSEEDFDCLTEGHEDGKKRAVKKPSSLSMLTDFLTPTPQSSLIYSSMQLPAGCLDEHDGCDEAELLARAKRCQEILKLSEEAKKAEAERVRIANIKPLSWAKPTFELPTPSEGNVDDLSDETLADQSGKRKRRQENTTLPSSSCGDRLCSVSKRVQTPEPEEEQLLVESTNKPIPSGKESA